MRYYKNMTDRQSCRLWALLIGLCLTCMVWAGGNHAHIKLAELTVHEDSWFLQADLDVQFSRVLEEALNKGIELTFLFEFQLLKPQKYWFDDEVLTERRYVMLSYHALTKQYLLQSDQHQKTFDTLTAARKELAIVRDWRLAPRAILDKGETYQAALKMHLDRSKLPKALQVDALGEADWDLVTPTFGWWVKDGSR